MALLVALAAGAPGCSGGHSALRTEGTGADRAAWLGWGMIAVASVITVGVLTAFVVGSLRDRPGVEDERRERRWVIGGGIVMPAVVLSVLSGLTVATLRAQDTSARRTRLRIEVTGYQYWWAVRYPSNGAVTANEIHVPVGTAVDVDLRSRDVIHSLWVPSLAGKTDLIPGQVNHMVLQARRAGRYRGQCAEFCGAQHANMAFVVVAEPPATFDRWRRAQARTAAEPRNAQAQEGRRILLAQPCAACHTIRGTSARGTVGPDLTHVASRQRIAAGTLANDTASLTRWVRNAQEVKPGALMPPIDLTPGEVRSIVAYLRELR
ncbi:MAG: cytochrome c oxidase subunit II [Actinobacteria bacterium]|nr:cytochrome c oxidase subunit II [Actinomycetota bacterium]